MELEAESFPSKYKRKLMIKVREIYIIVYFNFIKIRGYKKEL